MKNEDRGCVFDMAERERGRERWVTLPLPLLRENEEIAVEGDKNKGGVPLP